METQAAPRWTLEELNARVQRALVGDYAGVPNGQVRDVPNARTIRYYSTLGLIDRPAEMRGRTALYGTRHLRQLVAIKRLQAEGLPLVAVQERLQGLSDDALARIARVPREVERGDDDTVALTVAPASAPSRREGAFWAEAPPEPSAPAEGAVGPASQIEPRAPSFEGALAGLTLEGGLALTFPSARPLDESDLKALRAALGPILEPVLEVLRARGLLGPQEGEDR